MGDVFHVGDGVSEPAAGVLLGADLALPDETPPDRLLKAARPKQFQNKVEPLLAQRSVSNAISVGKRRNDVGKVLRKPDRANESIGEPSRF
jgi:hypothetical protein